MEKKEFKYWKILIAIVYIALGAMIAFAIMLQAILLECTLQVVHYHVHYGSYNVGSVHCGVYNGMDIVDMICLNHWTLYNLGCPMRM